MTTIFAVKCSDGIVMCSDTQESRTRELETKENVTKILPIGDNALLGCAGTVNYIHLLQSTVRNSLSTQADDYEKALYECSRQYAKEVYLDAKIAGNVKEDGSLPEIYQTEGIFVVCDSKFQVRMFELLAPYRPYEIKKPQAYRISIGSGGIISDYLFKLAEDQIMIPMGIDWGDLSASVVSQMCAIMLFTIGGFELHTGALARIYMLSKISQRPVELTPYGLWGNSDRPFKVFLKNLMGHHPELLKRFLNTYLDDDLKARLLGLMDSG